MTTAVTHAFQTAVNRNLAEDVWRLVKDLKTAIHSSIKTDTFYDVLNREALCFVNGGQAERDLASFSLLSQQLKSLVDRIDVKDIVCAVCSFIIECTMHVEGSDRLRALQFCCSFFRYLIDYNIIPSDPVIHSVCCLCHSAHIEIWHSFCDLILAELPNLSQKSSSLVFITLLLASGQLPSNLSEFQSQCIEKSLNIMQIIISEKYSPCNFVDVIVRTFDHYRSKTADIPNYLIPIFQQVMNRRSHIIQFVLPLTYPKFLVSISKQQDLLYNDYIKTQRLFTYDHEVMFKVRVIFFQSTLSQKCSIETYRSICANSNTAREALLRAIYLRFQTLIEETSALAVSSQTTSPLPLSWVFFADQLYGLCMYRLIDYQDLVNLLVTHEDLPALPPSHYVLYVLAQLSMMDPVKQLLHADLEEDEVLFARHICLYPSTDANSTLANLAFVTVILRCAAQFKDKHVLSRHPSLSQLASKIEHVQKMKDAIKVYLQDHGDLSSHCDEQLVIQLCVNAFLSTNSTVDIFSHALLLGKNTHSTPGDQQSVCEFSTTCVYQVRHLEPCIHPSLLDFIPVHAKMKLLSWMEGLLLPTSLLFVDRLTAPPAFVDAFWRLAYACPVHVEGLLKRLLQKFRGLGAHLSSMQASLLSSGAGSGSPSSSAIYAAVHAYEQDPNARLAFLLFQLLAYRLQRLLRGHQLVSLSVVTSPEWLSVRHLQLSRALETLVVMSTTCVYDVRAFRALEHASTSPMTEKTISAARSAHTWTGHLQPWIQCRQVVLVNLMRYIAVHGDVEATLLSSVMSNVVFDTDALDDVFRQYVPECLKSHLHVSKGEDIIQAQEQIQRSIHATIEMSNMHNSLLPRGQTADAEKALLEHYVVEKHQHLFLCVMWHITVLQKSVVFTMPNVRKVLLLFHPSRMGMYTHHLIMYLVYRQYSAGITEKHMSAWLIDYVFKYQLISLEHCVVSLLMIPYHGSVRSLKILNDLLLSQELLARVDMFTKTCLKTSFWEETNAFPAQRDFIHAYPDYSDYEAFSALSSTPRGGPDFVPRRTSSLPMYYENGVERFAQYLPFVIHKLCEYGAMDMLSTVMSKFGRLLVCLPTPLKFLHETMYYFYASPSFAEIATLLSPAILDLGGHVDIHQLLSYLGSAYQFKSRVEMRESMYGEFANPMARECALVAIYVMKLGLRINDLLAMANSEDESACLGILLSFLPEPLKEETLLLFKRCLETNECLGLWSSENSALSAIFEQNYLGNVVKENENDSAREARKVLIVIQNFMKNSKLADVQRFCGFCEHVTIRSDVQLYYLFNICCKFMYRMERDISIFNEHIIKTLLLEKLYKLQLEMTENFTDNAFLCHIFDFLSYCKAQYVPGHIISASIQTFLEKSGSDIPAFCRRHYQRVMAEEYVPS